MSIKPTKKYPQSSIDFLLENYPSKGVKYCAECLNLTNKAIKSFCQKYNIKFIPTPKYTPVEMGQFHEITNPRVAYWLGLMWADGHVKRGNENVVSMNLVESDAIRVYESFKEIAEFAVYHIPKLNSPSKPQIQFVLYGKEIKDFLISMDYKDKSLVAPTKILSHIPVKLHRFFWLGFLDGDGCLARSKAPEGFKYSLVFCGTQTQDWSTLEGFVNELGCSGKVYRKNLETNDSSGSVFKIGSKFEAFHIASLFYQSYEQDRIGNSRKYERFLELKEGCLTKTDSILGYRGVIKFENSKNFYAKYAKKHISAHSSPEDAARAYDLRVVEILGLKAKTNFPLNEYIKIGYSEKYS